MTYGTKWLMMHGVPASLTHPSFLHEPKATETSFNGPVEPI